MTKDNLEQVHILTSGVGSLNPDAELLADRLPGITLLLQQPGAPGLKVWHPESSCWIPVPAEEDHLVVNIGDLLNICRLFREIAGILE